MLENIHNVIIQQVNNATAVIPTLPPLTLSNLFGDMASASILLVLILAITVRQSSEFIVKWMKGEVEFFNRKYIAYAVIAFFTSLPLGIGLFGEAAKIFILNYGTWGFIGGLAMVAVYGYGWQHGTNKLASFLGHFFTAKKVETEKEDNTTNNNNGDEEINLAK